MRKKVISLILICALIITVVPLKAEAAVNDVTNTPWTYTYGYNWPTGAFYTTAGGVYFYTVDFNYNGLQARIFQYNTSTGVNKTSTKSLYGDSNNYGVFSVTGLKDGGLLILQGSNYVTGGYTRTMARYDKDLNLVSNVTLYTNAEVIAQISDSRLIMCDRNVGTQAKSGYRVTDLAGNTITVVQNWEANITDAYTVEYGKSFAINSQTNVTMYDINGSKIIAIPNPLYNRQESINVTSNGYIIYCYYKAYKYGSNGSSLGEVDFSMGGSTWLVDNCIVSLYAGNCYVYNITTGTTKVLTYPNVLSGSNEGSGASYVYPLSSNKFVKVSLYTSSYDGSRSYYYSVVSFKKSCNAGHGHPDYSESTCPICDSIAVLDIKKVAIDLVMARCDLAVTNTQSKYNTMQVNKVRVLSRHVSRYNNTLARMQTSNTEVIALKAKMLTNYNDFMTRYNSVVNSTTVANADSQRDSAIAISNLY